MSRVSNDDFLKFIDLELTISKKRLIDLGKEDWSQLDIHIIRSINGFLFDVQELMQDVYVATGNEIARRMNDAKTLG